MSVTLRSISELGATICDLQSVIVSAHISPDADAVGSACALGLGLAQKGCKVTFYFEDPLPEKIRELTRGISIVHDVPKAAVDAVLITDCATKKRFGRNADQVLALGKKTLNIDHHESNDGWAQINFVNAKASSSAEIIFSLLRELGVTFSTQMANLLYAGLLDDTGMFRYGNASEDAFLCAANLVQVGASPADVANVLYFSLPRRLIALRTKALETLSVHLGGKVALLYVSQATLEECGAKSEDTETLIDEARSVEGAVFAIFMREVEGGWKLSLRSKDAKFDVNKLAQVFGGGGHRQAAGCIIRAAREEAEKQILAEIAKLL